MTKPRWPLDYGELRRDLARSGFDLTQAFSVSEYNAAVAHEAGWAIEDFEAPDRLGLLIGNTRALWPIFTRAVSEIAELSDSEDPLDRYTERSVGAALRAAAGSIRHRLYFAHVTRPRAVPLGRLAEIAGFAALAPCHLSIHPTLGPWFALRAVAVLDAPGPSAAPALGAGDRHCSSCARPCVPALERALSVTGPALDRASIAEHAAAWIAIRDACPIGRGERYGERQLAYHYTKDRSLLRERP